MSEQSAGDLGSAKHHEREVGHSRHVIANAKLVVTFSVAIAATFVAGALQVSAPKQTRWDHASAWLMIPTAVFTICVILLPPGHRKGELKQGDVLNARTWARLAYGLMIAQVTFSAASSVVAALGLLFPKWQ
jgi:hypothetical protein